MPKAPEGQGEAAVKAAPRSSSVGGNAKRADRATEGDATAHRITARVACSCAGWPSSRRQGVVLDCGFARVKNCCLTPLTVDARDRSWTASFIGRAEGDNELGGQVDGVPVLEQQAQALAESDDQLRADGLGELDLGELDTFAGNASVRLSSGGWLIRHAATLPARDGRGHGVNFKTLTTKVRKPENESRSNPEEIAIVACRFVVLVLLSVREEFTGREAVQAPLFYAVGRQCVLVGL